MQEAERYSKEIAKIAKLKTPKELFTFLENESDIFSTISLLKVFVLDEAQGKYILKKNIARTKNASAAIKDIKLRLEDPVINHLLEIKKATLTKEVEENIAVALTKKRRLFLSLLRDRLTGLGAEVCVPGFAKDKLVTVFILGKKISREEFSGQEMAAFALLAKQSAQIIHNFTGVKKEVELFADSMRKINKALEAKDVYTRGHSDRVAQFSLIVGKKLHDELDKIPYGEISLYYAAELHDIGKVNLSDTVLKKESQLSAEEWKEMKRHPLESANIIKPLEKWLGNMILEGVIAHHENCDGSGYPYGKKGEQINILAKIIRVADSFDAMISDRPYRKALAYHKVISELKSGSGTKFDPKVIEAFLQAHKEGLFKEIFLSQMEGKS